MGGRLAIAIRRGNGTEYISGRWTNPLPHWLSNPKFWDDGPVVDEYIKSGLENNTPEDRVGPEEYGVVIIDFQTKRVFSRQDYCGIGDFTCGQIAGEDCENVLTLIELGWVTKYEVWRNWKDEDDREAAMADRFLHEDEIPKFHEMLRANVKPLIQHGSRRLARFDPGMVIVHFTVPGWTFDDGVPRDEKGDRVNSSVRAWHCWSEVEAFIKATGWKSPCWTTAEVKAEYDAIHDEPGEEADA
jgi:hypothetical protein